MGLYNALIALGDFLNSFRSWVFGVGISIRNVWLIGDNLYSPIATASAYIGLVAQRCYDAANAWPNIYYELKQGVGLPASIQTLVYYADDILSFIRYPDEWISDALRRYFSVGVQFLTDPVGAVVDVLARYTGFSYDFIYNPIGYIQDVVNGALGELRVITYNPVAWVSQQISSLFPFAFQIMRDPDGWLLSKIGATFPYLNEFMRDPDNFIVERFIAYVERLVDRYGQRLAKIAERIIHMMY